MKLSKESAEMLKEYLSSHESDIAWSANDFGELEYLFVEIFNRNPVDPLKSKQFKQLEARHNER